MKHFVDLIGYLAIPLVIVWLVLKYEDEIRQALRALPELVKRMTKAGPVEFQQPTSLSPADQRKQIEAAGVSALAPLPPDPDIKPYEDGIRRELAANNAIDAPDAKDRLIRALAWAIRSSEFEGPRALIFGTQYAALKALGAQGPLTPAAMQTFYSDHETRMREVGATAAPFLSWVGYLTGAGLAELDPNGLYRITDKGKRFLTYAKLVGLTEAKMF